MIILSVGMCQGSNERPVPAATSRRVVTDNDPANTQRPPATLTEQLERARARQ